jgi:transposase-like protein
MKKDKLWKCPRCGREFQRQNQSHSCKLYPLEKHFEGKTAGRLLYEQLKQAVSKQVGTFKILSLECCIHFDTSFTFAAVKIFKTKIQVHFRLHHKASSKRFKKEIQLSANSYLYYVDIGSNNEIDAGLLKWIGEACVS